MSTKNHESTPKTVPTDKKPDERLAAGIHSRLRHGKLPCARAFQIARELSVSPLEVGHGADLLKIKICQCQLGLFGYEPEKCIIQAATSVDSALKESILTGLVDGRLPCPTAFSIAKNLHISKMDVSAACESMELKISSCQLGAFV